MRFRVGLTGGNLPEWRREAGGCAARVWHGYGRSILQRNRTESNPCEELYPEDSPDVSNFSSRTVVILREAWTWSATEGGS